MKQTWHYNGHLVRWSGSGHPESLWEIKAHDLAPPSMDFVNDPGPFLLRCVAGPKSDMSLVGVRCWGTAISPPGDPLSVLALMARTQEEWEAPIVSTHPNTEIVS